MGDPRYDDYYSPTRTAIQSHNQTVEAWLTQTAIAVTPEPNR
ncbi:MAG TPA: hypothetical protein VHL11_05495 [Phototrophicaceae bacterium]|nr:hypothetical protein [Phototrophicaceae bacterium]